MELPVDFEGSGKIVRLLQKLKTVHLFAFIDVLFMLLSFTCLRTMFFV